METDINPLVDVNCNKFLTLPNEKMFIGKRQHWLSTIAMPIILSIFMETTLIIGMYAVCVIFLHSFVLLIGFGVFSISLTLGIIAKILIHWYFHLYIVTSRKILEITFSPLDSLIENHVLLDEVRCTEVDMKTAGIISELLGIGTITVTFDRPTQQQEFVFSNIKNYRKIGIFLSKLVTTFQNNDYMTPIRNYWSNRYSRTNA